MISSMVTHVAVWEIQIWSINLYKWNMVANSDNTAYGVDSISVMHDHVYPYYDTSLRICTVILLKSKTTDKKGSPYIYFQIHKIILALYDRSRNSIVMQ